MFPDPRLHRFPHLKCIIGVLPALQVQSGVSGLPFNPIDLHKIAHFAQMALPLLQFRPIRRERERPHDKASRIHLRNHPSSHWPHNPSPGIRREPSAPERCLPWTSEAAAAPEGHDNTSIVRTFFGIPCCCILGATGGGSPGATTVSCLPTTAGVSATRLPAAAAATIPAATAVPAAGKQRAAAVPSWASSAGRNSCGEVQQPDYARVGSGLDHRRICRASGRIGPARQGHQYVHSAIVGPEWRVAGQTLHPARRV